MIKFSISWDKFHFDIPIGPADKGDGHSNSLNFLMASMFYTSKASMLYTSSSANLRPMHNCTS